MTALTLRASILGSIALVLAACASAPPPAAPTEQSDTVASADGVPIRYHSYGNGKVSLVLVHGWSCDSRYWDNQVPDLRDRYRVVTLDLAGHGQSGAGRKDWTMAAYGADVAAVVKKLDLRGVVLIGHSMGGPVVIEAARLLPGRVIGVIGADTFRAIGGTPTPRDVLDQRLVPMRTDFRKSVYDMVRKSFFAPGADPRLVEWVADDMSQAPPGLAIESIISFDQWDWKTALAGQDYPLVAINSDLVPTDAGRIRAAYPRFEFRLVHGPGHFLMMDDPATFDRLVDETVRSFGVR